VAHGKRVSWVELYLDLLFVVAVGQLSHLIVEEPTMDTIWVALGLFVVMWWTWIGFAVLYNRLGAEAPGYRLVFLVGSVPIGVAAAAISPASNGDIAVFAGSMAAARLVIAAAHAANHGWQEPLRLRITRACMLSAGMFAVSIAVPEPWRYVLWGVAVAQESGVLLAEDRGARRRARRDRDLAALAPQDPAEALDAHHFAERFGLFLIILLGEVVVEAGQVSLDGHVAGSGGWAAIAATMIFAAALWWLYFDAAADNNLRVLEMSGGSPTLARMIFAVGHMLPAFALLLAAAGVGLLFEEDPPSAAYWLACTGLGIYLVGTRVVFAAATPIGRVARIALVIATFELAQLEDLLSPHEYIWLLAVWSVGCAALSSWKARALAVATLSGYPEEFTGEREPAPGTAAQANPPA
jgi:low temperature requirement protein LtrA